MILMDGGRMIDRLTPGRSELMFVILRLQRSDPFGRCFDLNQAAWATSPLIIWCAIAAAGGFNAG
jgi:hypothetical protein